MLFATTALNIGKGISSSTNINMAVKKDTYLNYKAELSIKIMIKLFQVSYMLNPSLCHEGT